MQSRSTGTHGAVSPGALTRPRSGRSFDLDLRQMRWPSRGILPPDALPLPWDGRVGWSRCGTVVAVGDRDVTALAESSGAPS